MAYQVIYEMGKKKRKRKSYIFPLTVVAFLGFLRLVSTCWPEGQAALTQFLIPEFRKIAVGAFDTFVTGLREGEAFWDAAQAFCQEVIQGVGIPVY